MPSIDSYRSVSGPTLPREYTAVNVDSALRQKVKHGRILTPRGSVGSYSLDHWSWVDPKGTCQQSYYKLYYHTDVYYMMTQSR